MGRRRYYVGHGHDRVNTVFLSATTPTQATHGEQYFAATGPFRTRTGAIVMSQYGENNPHCRTVADAERLAPLYCHECKGLGEHWIMCSRAPLQEVRAHMRSQGT